MDSEDSDSFKACLSCWMRASFFDLFLLCIGLLYKLRGICSNAWRDDKVSSRVFVVCLEVTKKVKWLVLVNDHEIMYSK